MRLLVQRAKYGRVVVDGATVAQTQLGLVTLVGFGQSDTSENLLPMAKKLVHLRIFANEQGRFDRSVIDVDGEILLIPQFTLYADTRKGRRPEFFTALEPTLASTLFSQFVAQVKSLGIRHVGAGIFGADMAVTLENFGPVTIWLADD